MKTITIKIQPQNIAGQNQPITFPLQDTDLFVMKAKKLVAEKIKGVNTDEFVFYSKQKNLIAHDEDRVGKFCLGKEIPEIYLYLTSDLLKRSLSQQISSLPMQQQIVQGTSDKTEKMEKEIQKLKEESLKLDNKLRIQESDHQESVQEYVNSIESLKTELNEQRETFEQRLKILEDQKSDVVEKYKAELNIVNQMKLDKIKFDKDLEDLKYQLKEMQYEKEDYEKQYNQLMQNSKKTQSSINESVYSKTVNDLDKYKKQLSNDQFELNKEKGKNQQLLLQISQQQSQLNKLTEDLQVARSNAQVEIEDLKQQIVNLQQKLQKLQDEIKTQKHDKETLKNNINLLREEKNELLIQIQGEEAKQKSLQQKLNELKGELQEKEDQITSLKALKERSLEQLTEKNDIWRNEKQELEMENKKVRDNLKKAQQKIIELETQLSSNEMKTAQLNQHLEQLVQKSNAVKKDAEIQIEKMMQELDKEKERANQEIVKRNQLAKRIKQNQVRKIGDGKIIGATESLLRTMANPFDYMKGENIMTDDLSAQVSILRIDVNKALELLLKNQSTELIDCINQETVGRWNIKKSIGINGDGSKRKGFMVQVIESDGGRYTDKFFLIKELVGYEKISSLEKAIFVAQNQLIARVLAIMYQSKMLKASAEKLPCQFQYPEPFLLQTDGNIYIAEQLTQGKLVKFNGEGESIDKDQRIASFLNAFSLFTYQATQQMLMVSNVQGIFDGAEYLMCDPILSSPEGILGDEDLGEPHILQFQANHKENPKNYGKQFLSTMGIRI